MVSTCGLHDLEFVGPHFTWYRGNCSVHLDRCLGNSQWFAQFPRSILHHLARIKSDHRLICLATVAQTIKGFTAAVSTWNFEVFGSIGRNKKVLMARLRGVQRCLDQKCSSNMVKLEDKLLQELETLLEQEELLWK
ncbi:hypothetical protein V6N13_098668 [Hibiscus sabdariffa]